MPKKKEGQLPLKQTVINKNKGVVVSASEDGSEINIESTPLTKALNSLEAAKETIAELEKQNKELSVCLDATTTQIGVVAESNESLSKENESLKGELNEVLEQSAFTTIEGRDIKTEMLIALLPQVDIKYAKTNAERALIAVDEIMKAWDLE